MQPLAVSELQKHTIWLMGVLVSLAIKEAITQVSVVFANRIEPWDGLLALARLTLFLPVSLGFYLGTVQYFNVVFGQSASAIELRRRRFAWDVVFGFTHFAVVCFWGLSIGLLEYRWLVFPGLLLVVLLCDVLWYVWAVSQTRRTIRIRVLVNAFAAAWATLAFGATALAFMCVANGWRVELTRAQGAICEAAAYIPVFVASVTELVRLVYGRGIQEWLLEALSRPGAQSG
jgi:hypothetical protein